jgi:hypothetical protein
VVTLGAMNSGKTAFVIEQVLDAVRNRETFEVVSTNPGVFCSRLRARAKALGIELDVKTTIDATRNVARVVCSPKGPK